MVSGVSGNVEGINLRKEFKKQRPEGSNLSILKLPGIKTIIEYHRLPLS